MTSLPLEFLITAVAVGLIILFQTMLKPKEPTEEGDEDNPDTTDNGTKVRLRDRLSPVYTHINLTNFGILTAIVAVGLWFLYGQSLPYSPQFLLLIVCGALVVGWLLLTKRGRTETAVALHFLIPFFVLMSVVIWYFHPEAFWSFFGQ